MTIQNAKGLRSHYLTTRACCTKLGEQLGKFVTPDVLEQGAADLEMLNGKSLIIRTESELPILMDHCIYDVRRQGRNAVESFLVETPPDDDSLEMECLHAMQQAYYSVFVVETVEPNLGIYVRDEANGGTLLVADIGFSKTAVPDTVLASRLLPFADFAATAGAALPLGVISGRDQFSLCQNLTSLLTRDTAGLMDPTALIRTCLEAEAALSVSYAAADGESSSPMHTSAYSRAPGRRKIGRNESCPCGSGKKFKRCCGRG